ncbi:ankyrin repeat domain-containing protein [Infirmifilum sp. NZ]|uniref:ankyrin repeat domain-containing protein n=1 Tax=Infirmifilum sp. NZ TaxID=2926850 RepID=UPI0027A0056A|nr:ankyrin repeat domain-containing protein [Infirmifilum sp. NZ]UNQ73406.1 ankyrin repeat domain-containing protein [Infirmifilum sp. NZ]
MSELHFAAGIGDLEKIRMLLERGADINARDNIGWTPLHFAAIAGKLDVARLLIEKGADVNARGVFGDTPLHYAAMNGHLDVVKLLVDSGADVDARDEYGRTPWDLARERGHVEVVRLLESAEEGRSAQPARLQPVKSQPAEQLLVSVEAPRLVAGEWGSLKVRLSGRARLLLEGEVDWLDPGEAEGLIEIPVRLKKAGRVPVVLVARWEGGEERRVVWLEAAERAERSPLREQATLRACPSCGAPVEPWAKYCWRCGAKL